MEEKYSFKASQTFVLRDGWTQKAIIEMHNHPNVNVFSKKDGVIYLGVGTNMVASIKYWLEAAHIISNNSNRVPELTDLGKWIQRKDPYLESPLSWSLIHINLAKNRFSAPLFWVLFHRLGPSESFTKESFCDDVAKYFESKGVPYNPQYIEDDFSVLVRSYLPSGKSDPEDNMDCPLSSLGLLKQIDRGQYRKTPVSIENIDIRVIYYLTKEILKDKDSIPFEDIVSQPDGPCFIFNLDRNTLMSIFMSLDNSGFVKVVRSAGLNTVYFLRKKYKLKDLFTDVMGGNKNENL